MASKAKLRVEVGVGRGREYELEDGKPFYVGRDRKCDYYIPTGRASRVHCKIEGQNDAFGVFDLDSRNGTLVNGQNVTSRVLRPGDIVEVAGNRLAFLLGEAQPIQLKRMGGVIEEGKPTSESPPEAIVTAPRPKSSPAKAPGADFESELGAFEYTDEDKALLPKALGSIKLLSIVGKGQRCVTYKGSDSEKNRLVAVKTLRPDLADDPDLRRWFVHGAKRAAELRHENAVKVVRGGREGEMLYVVLQFMERNAYQRFRDVAGDLSSVKSALQTVVNVTRALEFGAREHQELHNGVRPSKILYDERRQGKLACLGFPNGLGSPGVRGGEKLIAYMAPELVNQGGQPNVRTDIYALGATFYHMLAGMTPVRDGRGAIGSPKRHNSAIPDSLLRIIEKMVAPAPGDRFESYSHLLHDLRWALRGETWHRA